MGFSTVAGFVILLMVSITIGGYLLHVVVDQVKDFGKLSKLVNERRLEIKNSNFEIVEIETLTSNTTYDLRVVVKNTGATTFDCKKFTILVDGVLVNYTVNVSKLYPLESAEFEVENLEGTAGSTHRVVIVSDNGIKRISSYTVT